jgi:hypothetical protein
MDMFVLLFEAIGHIAHALWMVLSSAFDILEAGLKAPLKTAGLPGVAQTILMLLVPVLTMIASIKLLGGILRVALVVVSVAILAHMVVPMLLAAPGIA